MSKQFTADERRRVADALDRLGHRLAMGLFATVSQANSIYDVEALSKAAQIIRAIPDTQTKSSG